MAELSTVLGMGDAYEVLEVLMVDAVNRSIARRAAEKD